MMKLDHDRIMQLRKEQKLPVREMDEREGAGN